MARLRAKLSTRRNSTSMKTLPLAGCVIKHATDKILLIHRNTPELTQWELPGGKLEAGETLIQAAVREMQEEIGVAVTVIRELGRDSFVDRNILWDYTWFLAKTDGVTVPYPVEDKHDRLAYYSLEELGRLELLSPNVKNLLTAISRKEVEL